MLELNFDNFRVKNKNKTKAFEDMCRVIFLRELKKYTYDYSYGKNQGGLEIEPILNINDDKYYGLQVKFFETVDNTKKYQQIEDSLDKAYKYYKNLDYIYIYTNAELQHSVSDEEVNGDKSTPRIRIERKARKNDVTLKWVQKDNILDKVKSNKNLDLYNLYFSGSRELDFLESNISIEDKTFLMSDEYLKLGLSNELSVWSPQDKRINTLTLLLGSAGTGKSMLMKKKYLELSSEYIDYYLNTKNIDNEIYIPIFIKLKEICNSNFEEIIRARMRDYGLNHTDSRLKFIYLLDGLDEVSEKNLYSAINALKRIEKIDNGRVIISSRVGSNNLIFLRQTFNTKDCYIEDLNLNDIEKYFDIKNDKNKIKRLGEISDTDIIKSIDDIFSLKLLWDNIENINEFTTKINMIEISVKHWIECYYKLSEVPLLEPKGDRLFQIFTEIAFKMQENLSVSITLKELHALIIQKFDINNATDVNIIVSALLDLFLEYSSYSSENERLSFRHRRFQEYFLYKKIYIIFFNNPSILRKLNLLSNKDFIITVFLKTSLVDAKKDKDIFRYLALNLFEAYLGEYYIEKKYKDEIIGTNYLFGTSQPSYTYSNRFITLLSTYSEKNLLELLDNIDLGISNALTEENYWKLIELYHRNNNADISKKILERYDLEIDKISNKDFDSFVYYLYRIQNKSIDEIKNIIEENGSKLLEISDEDIKSKYNIESNLKMVNSLIKTILEFEICYLGEKIYEVDNLLLEVISYWCLKFKNIDILLGETNIDFRKRFTERVENKEEKYYIHTIVLYNFINNKQIEIEQMEEEFEKNNIYHYWTWHNNIELNIFLSYVLKKDKFELTEFQQGVNILSIFLDEENNQENILNKWIEEIKQYNYIYKNAFIYSNTKIISELISNWNFDPLLIKQFLRKITEYESVIYFETLLFIIFENNKKLFNDVINKSILDYAVGNSLKTKEYYESKNDSLYSLAAMYTKFDISKRYNLLMKGLNNDIFRPAFKGEDLFDRIMIESIDIAFENYWINKSELEEKLTLIYKYIVELTEATDNGKNLNYLKFVIEKHIPNSQLLNIKDFYEINSYDYREVTRKNKSNIDDIDKINLKKYYKCNMEAPYHSLDLWEKLIELEFEENNYLDILFDVFKECKYPSMEGYPIFNYIHIPTSILLRKNETKDKMLEFIFNNPGRNGIFNMLRVYSLLGEVDLGKKLLKFLFEFGKALLDVEEIDAKSDTQIEYVDVIQSSSKDWIINESDNYAYLKRNKEIVIKWNDFDGRKKFHEEWATKHIDESAYMYEYKLYKDNKLIKEFNLVYVDGYRALLPMPKLGTNIVPRDEYHLSRIFNNNIDELNNYMILSGLIVE